MEAYRRHIVIDNITRTIYIEVQPLANGNLKRWEYDNIKAGMWHQYVPAEIRTQFAAAINNGFSVRPCINSGGKSEGYYFIQIVDVLDKAIIQ